MADLARHVDPVQYPESDDVPMAETPLHADVTVDLVHQLRWHLRPLIHERYVGFDNFWYYVEGNPKKVVAPDVYVVAGVPQDRSLRVWKTWVDGVVPGVVFEITSSSSRVRDLGPKRVLYQTLGVRELWLFDPLGDYLDPRLRGFELVADAFVPIEPDGDRWHSRWLQLDLAFDGNFLALTHGDEPRPPRFTEMPEAFDDLLAEAELARAEAESARAEAAAHRARIQELEAAVARLSRD